MARTSVRSLIKDVAETTKTTNEREAAKFVGATLQHLARMPAGQVLNLLYPSGPKLSEAAIGRLMRVNNPYCRDLPLRHATTVAVSVLKILSTYSNAAILSVIGKHRSLPPRS